MEVVGEPHISEERGGVVHGEFTFGFAPVDEEVDGEDGLAIGGDKANVAELEFGIRGDGVLDARIPEFSCDGEVVEASAVAIAEIYKLVERLWSVSMVW